MENIETEILAELLKSAFNRAVYLGYGQTTDLLVRALDQVKPLTYLERKAASRSITEEQSRALLNRDETKLKEDEAKGNGTLASRDKVRGALFMKRFNLDYQAREARELLDIANAEARKLALKMGKPEVAATIAKAQQACKI